MKSYLVTGGSGFIGASIVKRLVHEGNRVRVFDNNSRGSLRRLEHVIDKIEFIQGDIRNTDLVKAACDGMDAVVHLAYINGTQYFYTRPGEILDVGVRGMLSILDGCRHAGVREFVLFSSSEVYQTPHIIPTPEDVPFVIPDVMNPRFTYGGGKAISEQLLIHFGSTYIDKATIIRPHNVYGPDMGFEHVLPQLICRAIESIESCVAGPISFPIQGDGNQTRSFIFIDDFTKAVMDVLKNSSGISIYNIGTLDEVTIRSIVKKIFSNLKREYNLVPASIPKGGTLRRCPDISKLSALGFVPKYSLDQGVDLMVRWYKENYELKRSEV